MPAYVSPIAVVFNLAGVTTLQPRRQDDRRHLRRQDHHVERPGDRRREPRRQAAEHRDHAVHRSDDSGTTFNFTDYLSKAGDGAWTDPADKVWPIKGGEGAEGTSGVIAAVNDTARARSATPTTQPGRRPRRRRRSRSAATTSPPTAEGAARCSRPRRRRRTAPASDMAIDIDRTATEAAPTR